MPVRLAVVVVTAEAAGSPQSEADMTAGLRRWHENGIALYVYSSGQTGILVPAEIILRF